MFRDFIERPIKESVEKAKSQNSIRLILTCLSLSMLLSSLGTSIANVALPTLSQTFNAAFQEVQWIVLAYLLAITILTVTIGRLGDIIGRRRMLLSGIILFILASVFCGVSTNLYFLIVIRFFQGIGGAAMMTLSLAFIGEIVQPNKTGSAMGLLGTMSAIGTALGPSLGGILISLLGWQSVFLINVPIGVLNLILSYYYLPTDSQLNKNKVASFDKLGTFLLFLTLGSYTLALTIGRGNFRLINLILLGVVVAGLWLLIFVEKRNLSPLLNLAFFKDRELSTGLGLSVLVATVLMTTLVVGPFYLSRSFAFNPTLVGVIMSIGPLVVILSGFPIGHLVDKIGARRLTNFGLIGIMIGSLILSIVPFEFGLFGYVGSIIILTMGYAMFQTANNTNIMKNVQFEQRGVISGLLNLSRNLGLITGTTVMGAIFAFATGTSELTTAQPEAIAGGMRITFAIVSILIFLALIFQLKNQTNWLQLVPKKLDF